MRTAIIGAGRVACSIGKYFVEKGIDVRGYYSRTAEHTKWAADFTHTQAFLTLEECVESAQMLLIGVSDDAISDVWKQLCDCSLENKMIVHFSGSLTSTVFVNRNEKGAEGASMHPMFAFSSKENSWKELSKTGFSLEGDERVVLALQTVLQTCGNETVSLKAENKPVYHAAASVLSNFVVGVLQTGYELMEQAGFTPEETRRFSAPLVRQNVRHVIEDGAREALTGPIERNDVQTVANHLSCLDEEKRTFYQVLGRKLCSIAQQKYPQRDFENMRALLEDVDYESERK